MRLFRIIFRIFGISTRRPPYRGRPVWRAPTNTRRDNPYARRRETAVIYVEKAKREVTTLTGRVWVIDGDTIIINKVRIRLAGIDAPELDHPWGQKSKWRLAELCRGQAITARIKPELSYDRIVAQCFLPDGRDLAAELVREGLALDWSKYSGGKYRHLEALDARRKLWRADARQKGRLRV